MGSTKGDLLTFLTELLLSSLWESGETFAISLNSWKAFGSLAKILSFQTALFRLLSISLVIVLQNVINNGVPQGSFVLSNSYDDFLYTSYVTPEDILQSAQTFDPFGIFFYRAASTWMFLVPQKKYFTASN